MSFPESNEPPYDNKNNELSDMVEQYLIGMATQGKLPGQISDDQLKQILLSAQQPKRDFKINRV